VSATSGNPIHVTFVIHFDPLFAPGGNVPRWSYEAERDNLAWLVDYLEQVEKQGGRDRVPRLHLQLAGDHAEWYLEDEQGLDLLRRLYQKGLHSFGTHFHRNYKAGAHLWQEAPPSPQAVQRVTQDHIAEVDRLIGKIIGNDDPQAIREVNRTITGHLVDQRLAEQMGFTVQTGGRNEAMNLFFDHDVYNPWRPAAGWPLGEDLRSRWLLIPQAPVLGSIGEHSPIPTGVPDEYTRGMQRMVWQDLSVPAMKRKFLHLYLDRMLNEAGMPVAHHGANRPPNPQPIHRVKGENWADDVQAILDYESHVIDPRTGEDLAVAFLDGEPGGESRSFKWVVPELPGTPPGHAHHRAVFEAVRRGSAGCPGEEGMAALRICEAARRSAAAGAWVDVAPA